MKALPHESNQIQNPIKVLINQNVWSIRLVKLTYCPTQCIISHTSFEFLVERQWATAAQCEWEWATAAQCQREWATVDGEEALGERQLTDWKWAEIAIEKVGYWLYRNRGRRRQVVVREERECTMKAELQFRWVFNRYPNFHLARGNFGTNG